MKARADLEEDVNVKLVRIFGFLGVIVPVFCFTMIFLAIQTSPWFSWTGNALSDLGVSGLGAIFFNSGLVITGGLMMVFSLGLLILGKGSWMGRLGSIFFLSSALFLCGIGVFPETAGKIHYYFSVAFFVSLPLSLLVQGVFMARHGMEKFGLLSFASAAFAVGIWLPPWNSVAIPEALSALAVGVWSSALGLWMMKREEPN